MISFGRLLSGSLPEILSHEKGSDLSSMPSRKDAVGGEKAAINAFVYNEDGELERQPCTNIETGF